jgi:hypothetical protein
MKHSCKQLVTTCSLVVAVCLPALAAAESTVATGAGTLSTSAHVDFRIVIPEVLRFQVGSAGGTVDMVDFQPSASVIGNGSDVAATTGSGDQGNGSVTVAVLSNAGQITISHDSNGAALSDGGSHTIPYTEILTASSDAVNLDAPVLGTAGTSTPSLTGNLTNATATWTYTYDNSALYNSGVYGGVNTNGGRVTYTAASP